MNKKIALVTGSARRVGAQIAKTLHAHGYNIILHYRHSEAEATTLAKQLNQKRENSAVIVSSDLSQVSQISTLIEKAVNVWGQLDLLVNNASSFYPTPLGEVTEKAWDELHASNVKGAFFLSQEAYPHLCQTKGQIINIIDIHGEKPLKNYSAYSIAKAGLAMATKSLAKEMAPLVRVNGVSPGAVDWPEGVNTLDNEQKQRLLNKIPLHRHGSPLDIANTVLFLAQQNYITGEIIKVDGGRTI